MNFVLNLLRPLDSRELVAESGISRKDADDIADSLFHKVVDKFIAENILTDQERCNPRSRSGA